MTNTTYEIQVIARGQDARLVELREAVAAELLDLGLHQTVAVVVGDAAPGGCVPAIAVYLGSEDAAGDADVAAATEAAVAGGLVVIPVVDELERFARAVPGVLRPINGFGWSEGRGARGLARVLLAELGIEDRQRRVFISHKREDGLGAAEQLHDVLTHRAFTPFIDRFVIREGEPVQEAIADAIEDHAFLLLLETPLAHLSGWVFDEVHYALSHTLGTLIVRWPGDVEPVPGSEGLPRLVAEPDDVVLDEHGYDVLGASAVERVLAAVEAAHASGLVRRRRMLVDNVERAATAAGATCVALPKWRVLVEHGAARTMVGVTPRLPTAEDLHALDAARIDADERAQAVLVHSARALREERAAHLAWVTGSRDLELTPEDAIGGRWR
jgi:hypothetical protein